MLVFSFTPPLYPSTPNPACLATATTVYVQGCSPKVLTPSLSKSLSAGCSHPPVPVQGQLPIINNLLPLSSSPTRPHPASLLNPPSPPPRIPPFTPLLITLSTPATTLRPSSVPNCVLPYANRCNCQGDHLRNNPIVFGCLPCQPFSSCCN